MSTFRQWRSVLARFQHDEDKHIPPTWPAHYRYTLSQYSRPLSTAALELFAQQGPGGGPAVKNPSEREPEPYRVLVRDPDFKNARLLINEAPLGVSDPLDRWEEHKRAMHLKALKRSGLDHPDLRHEVELLTGTGPAADP